MPTYFVAFQYERFVTGGSIVGFGNCVQQFDFHPLTDPGRAGREIAATAGHDVVTVINVQDMPGNEF